MSWDEDQQGEDATPQVSDAELNPALSQLISALQQQEESTSDGFRQLRDAVAALAESWPQTSPDDQSDADSDTMSVEIADDPQQEVHSPLPPAEVVPTGFPVQATHAVDSWPQILLGHELATSPAIHGQITSLIQSLSEGESAATGLVGHLLVFRSSAPDKMPRLLKEVGEAYYRWQPYSHAPDAMRDALIGWLERLCESRGIQNKIRVVQLGDRFDSTRHSAKERGIEISEVYGWIVLRDNGRVFSKANVAVK